MQPINVAGRLNSRNKCQEFNGVLYYEKKGQGYYQSKIDSSYLHRAVWQYHNGEIPEGFAVHHKDHNKANNRIENLELLSHSDHSKHHAKHNDWVGSEQNRQQLIEAGQKAKEWHASDEGRAWHKEHGKKCWDSRPMYELICLMCGDSFESPWPNKTKFCHQNCKMNYRRWRLKGFAPDLKPEKRKA